MATSRPPRRRHLRLVTDDEAETYDARIFAVAASLVEALRDPSTENRLQLTADLQEAMK